VSTAARPADLRLCRKFSAIPVDEPQNGAGRRVGVGPAVVAVAQQDKGGEVVGAPVALLAVVDDEPARAGVGGTLHTGLALAVALDDLAPRVGLCPLLPLLTLALTDRTEPGPTT
jgi:hypothetical protein